MEKQHKNINFRMNMDFYALLSLGILFILLTVMCFFDGTLADENFYLTIPMRLSEGDGLFTDEWHLSQLSGVLLYIPYRLFTAISGGTEGLLIFFRILFCLFQLGTALAVYRLLRKEGFAAVLISSFFMVFAVIGLQALSYNTMGLSFMLLISSIIYTKYDEKAYKLFFAAGALLAGFILCQPFGIVLFPVYILAVIIFFCVRKKYRTPEFFTIRSAGAVILGILPVFIFFVYLMLKNSDIETVIKCIPHILSDPEHMTINDNLGTEAFSFVSFFKDMLKAAGAAPLIICILSIIIAAVLKKFSRGAAALTACAGLVIFSVWFYVYWFGSFKFKTDLNFIHFPLALSGIAWFILLKKKNYPAFIYFWCMGILYALMMTGSSNLSLHTSINGYFISSAGAVIMGHDLINELKDENIKLNKTAALILAITLISTGVFHTIGSEINSYVLRFGFFKGKQTIEEGYYKGIRFPADQYIIYNGARRDAELIKDIAPEGSRIFVCGNLPSCYLELPSLKPGSFSCWFIDEQLTSEEVRERFRAYYEIFPENIPQYVYAPAAAYTKHGVEQCSPKILMNFASALFEGKTTELYKGILIEVTGIKEE